MAGKSTARVSQRPPNRLQRRPPSLAELDLSPRVGHRDYEAKLSRRQQELKEISLAYRAHGRRAVVVFEGWDAAGKGGIIRRLGWPLDPRGFKVWPIAAPLPDEQGQPYLYRFWRRLPYPGQLVVFDRSWYGRVLVERVEGLLQLVHGPPEGLLNKLRTLGQLVQLGSFQPKTVRNAPCQELVFQGEDVDLGKFPVLKC